MSHDEQDSILVPKILWAQRKEVVYVTIEVVEAREENLAISEASLSVDARNDVGHYQFSMDLYAAVNPAESTSVVTGRNIFVTLKKADTDASFWPRLVKTGKPANIATDFARWKDEDDEESDAEADFSSAAAGGMGGMDFSQLAAMQNMMNFGGAMGGADFDGPEDEAMFEDAPEEEQADDDDVAEELQGGEDDDPYAKEGSSAANIGQ